MGLAFPISSGIAATALLLYDFQQASNEHNGMWGEVKTSRVAKLIFDGIAIGAALLTTCALFTLSSWIAPGIALAGAAVMTLAIAARILLFSTCASEIIDSTFNPPLYEVY